MVELLRALNDNPDRRKLFCFSVTPTISSSNKTNPRNFILKDSLNVTEMNKQKKLLSDSDTVLISIPLSLVWCS
jgi:hypothetical protein